MSIRDIVYDVRRVVTEEELVPLTRDNADEFISDGGTYDEFAEALEKEGLSVENIVCIDGSLLKTCYYLIDGGGICEIMINREYLEFSRIRDRIDRVGTRMRAALEAGNYATYLALTPSQLRLVALERIYWSIPEGKRYQAWKDAYVTMDFSGTRWNRDILNDVFERAPGIADNDGSLTIYRGCGSWSESIHDAISWTTDREIAEKFARNDEEDGYVLTAKTLKSAIMDIINDRGEHGVLVRYDGLRDIRRI